MNDNEETVVEWPPEIAPVPCEICESQGDIAVVRLDRGDLAVMAACAMHWPAGAVTPEAWVEQEQARIEGRMRQMELLYWVLGGKVPEGQVLQ